MCTGIIYKIYNLKDTSQFYIGSTINFSGRKSHHKKNVTNKCGKRYWTKLYLYIRNNGGWINFGMEQIIKQEFNSLNELHAFEQSIIINLKPTLNSICAHVDKSQPIN
jgi:predicted GIY-YIG superfamily endonuclease